ncbi:MAG: isopeptide-forming domain-containing fimbrial protein [Ruminococcus sp.]|nr:isopeptide-forming domain-containing fimbrial protein [Ruminococcus sp.]
MKHSKKFTAMIAALALTACSIAPIFSSAAAEKDKITISSTGVENDTANHSYTLYKIFGGTAESANIGERNGSATLTDVTWALTDEQVTAFLNAITGETEGIEGLEDFTLTDDQKKTAAGVAKALNDYTLKETTDSETDVVTKTTDTAKVKALSQWLGNNASLLTQSGTSTDGTFDVTEDGYYIVVENDFDITNGNVEGSKTFHLLGVYKADEGAEITVKASAPRVVKKVKENEKEVALYEGETLGSIEAQVNTDIDVQDGEQTNKWNDVADYNIGDDVPFKLYGTMPSTLEDYDHYYYEFSDTLGKEFTIGDKFTLTVAGTELTYTKNAEGKYVTLTTGLNTDISVTVNATNDNTTISIAIEDIRALGTEANPVTKDTIAMVEYEAKLNKNAVIGLPGQLNEVNLIYSNNPNEKYNPKPDGEEEKPKEKGETPKDRVIVFTYELDVNKIDGATKEKLQGVEFVVLNSDNKYAVVDEDGIITGFTEHAPLKAGEEAVEGRVYGSTFTSDENGNFTLKGLDDGTYILRETKALEGYNEIGDIKLKLEASTENDQDWVLEATAEDQGKNALKALDLKKGTITKGEDGAPDTTTWESVYEGTADDNSNDIPDELENNALAGKVDLTVVNNSGTPLPSTGGIGTTLFYLGGGAMVAVAGVFLITKKRMGKQED